jgi:hypothetical protein
MSHKSIARAAIPMSQPCAVSSPATGGCRGNGRKANFQEKSYEQ